jgi:hypothetical protein
LQDALSETQEVSPTKFVAPVQTPAEVQAELAAAQKQIEMLKQQDAEADKQLKIDEEGLLAQKALENKDDELRRARLISQALLMGKVKEYISDPQFGSFIIFEPTMPEQIQVGSVLGVRRNTGILAHYKVSEVTAEGVIANPMSGIGPVEPKVGDELIFPPQF